MARAGLDAATVLEAAAALADAEGLPRLTLAALARRLGVRAPSLYEHVGGLDDLRSRLCIDAAGRLRDVLLRAAAGRAGADGLRAVADAYRAFAHAHPGLYAALQVAPTPGNAEGEAAAAEVVEIVAAVLAGYGLDGDDAIHGVRIVRSALHGFVSIELEGGFGLPLDLERSWAQLLAMLDRGLGAGLSSAP